MPIHWCKVYGGNLHNNGNKTELEWALDIMGYSKVFGLQETLLGFDFIAFQDPRDSAIAHQELDKECFVAVMYENRKFS